VHELLFSALEPVLPDRVQAGNGLLHYVYAYGEQEDGAFYNTHFFVAGGRGAGRGRDGIGRNGFPSSARNVPVEIFELRTPVLVRRRALQRDSGGAGEWCGACGHVLEFSVLPGHPRPVSLFFDPDRLRIPPPGFVGGEDGQLVQIAVDGRVLSFEEIASGQVTLSSLADVIQVRVPGGGGYGPKEQRDPELIAEDERWMAPPPSER
jgi:N-methylhydantoinase B/oxoprolinase/acetone carboxylase alpha subunit